MKESCAKYMKGFVFVIVAMYAVIISGSLGIAGDYTMQKNLTDIADLMSKWSQQLSTGKLDATTQEKLGAIMTQASGVLRDMTMQGQDDMQMDYHNKIMEMEKEWDPFDTSDKM